MFIVLLYFEGNEFNKVNVLAINERLVGQSEGSASKLPVDVKGHEVGHQLKNLQSACQKQSQTDQIQS